jgi:hypothetical protein
MPPPRSLVQWDDWQVGPTQVPIPDTCPGSEHDGISFACFKCGASIVEGHQIHKVKQAAIWTWDASSIGRTIKLGDQFYNEYKKVLTQAVCCMMCNKSVGAIYRERYYLAEEGTPFPCVKLYLSKEKIAGDGNDEIHNDLVLRSESRFDAGLAVSRLVRVQGAEEGVQMRTTKHTFELKKIIETARMSALSAAAEAQANAAKAAAEMREAQVHIEVEKRNRAEAQKRAQSAAMEAQANAVKAAAEIREAQVRIEVEKRARAEAQKRAQSAAEEAKTNSDEAKKEKLLREQAEAKANLIAAKYASEAAKKCPRQWSYEETDDEFLPYAEGINALINAAYNSLDPTKSASVKWTERGFDYIINWEAFMQVNMKTGTSRLIEYTEVAPAKALAAVKSWASRGQSLSNGVVRHSIRASDVDQSETRELAEFNFAYAQLQKLLVSSTSVIRNIRVQQVDVYESPLVERNYAIKKLSMAQSRELWVFHGTNNIEAIMSGGFKVGGQDIGVRVVHGSVFGFGVYTATGPNTPMQYARSSGENKRVILAKALEGAKGPQGTSDCWAPKDDWLVFKTGEQLLPKYVVYWA